MSFLELCLKGDLLIEEIDNYVEDWHEGRAGANQELHEFLGMRWDEYSAWAKNPSILSYILAARRNKISLEEELDRDRYALAARASTALEARRIAEWLEQEVES